MSTKIEAKQFKEKLLNWMAENGYGDEYGVMVLAGNSPENLMIRANKVDKLEDFEPRLNQFILFQNLSGEYKRIHIELIDDIGENKRSFNFRRK
jgi:hypothetical protein